MLCWSASLSADLYDDAFRQASEVWMPAQDWRRLKAQCYQESLLEPDAQSPVGAMGLCQFMPATWGEVSRALKIRDDAWNPYASITAAAYYKSRMLRIWSAPRPEMDRTQLAEASYNAGAGNIIRAQRSCGGPALYADIIICLGLITGASNSHETRTYVERIGKWHNQLRLID